ncbi:MAG TPA: uracil-DNA glycosylase [Pyrinomonadaceae bacterium]|nr:uracil-DNA glycosylase [Pyrinomonadaceae bacterium]
MQTDNSRSLNYALLVAEAAICTRCPSMCERSAVLSELNGSLDARILFIGEAPGRKGADRTRIPFSGDQSGKNFDRFLSAAGLSRSEIFITSAALCNPRTQAGANRKPSKTELANCSDFLARTMTLLDPAMVVTLGSVALEALKRIHHHELNLKQHVATMQEWHGRLLVPLYHPSPQVLASHRREREQLQDYRTLAKGLQQAGLRV